MYRPNYWLMRKLPLSLFIFLLIIILILIFNLFISPNGFKERKSLIDENEDLSTRNNVLRNSNEELRFEIINAQDNNEHIENYAREKLNLTMPEEQFIKFEDKEIQPQDEK